MNIQHIATTEVLYEPTHALLNVRSIVAKLPDIRADKYLRCASILCSCEIVFEKSWIQRLKEYTSEAA